MSNVDEATDENPNAAWLETVPTLTHFALVGDVSRYVPLPDSWYLGLSDVLDSTESIASGDYKAVNLAGAGTISSVTNALGGDLKLFVFGGDGAQFAAPPEHKSAAESALDGVRSWAERGLGLNLRVAWCRLERSVQPVSMCALPSGRLPKMFVTPCLLVEVWNGLNLR